MGAIKLYREFYVINIVNSANTSTEIYNLINPFALTASTFSATTNSPFIENGIIINQESTGIYSVDLNPNLYSSGNIYDLVWSVNYTFNAPTKNLITRFKVNTTNIGKNIDIEIISQNLNIEVISKKLEIIINKN